MLFGDPYSSFRQNINAAGDATFVVHLTGSGVTNDNDVAMWSESGPSGLHLVAREGDQAPGMPTGVRLDELSFLFVQNAMGQVVFRTTLTGPGVDESNDTAMWIQDADGGTTLIARAGQTAPGAGTPFQRILYPHAINESGVFAFRALLQDHSPLTSESGDGIWIGSTSGGVEALAVLGDSVPGVTDARFEQFLSDPGINSDGSVVFTARIIGGSIDADSDEGVWMYDQNGHGELIALEGQRPTGFPSDVRFGQASCTFYPKAFYGATINESGQVFFGARIIGGDYTCETGYGFWLTDSTGHDANRLWQTGAQAPGTPDGTTFRYTINICLNGDGQIGVACALTGPGVDASNDVGLWMTDANGELHLVAREGDAFDVDQDPDTTDLRTVSAIVVPTSGGGADGLESPFNADGELAFRLSFTNSTAGIFKAKFGDFPCPVDLDGNGALNFDDINAFIEGFLDGDSAADLTGDGALNFDDIDAFVSSFLVGCP
ncbi:MAG: GC-type dockerin domain-anchored protein [Phycisphaerales bacterium]